MYNGIFKAHAILVLGAANCKTSEKKETDYLQYYRVKILNFYGGAAVLNPVTSVELIVLPVSHKESTYSFSVERWSLAQCEVRNVSWLGEPQEFALNRLRMHLCLFTKLLLHLGRDTINDFITSGFSHTAHCKALQLFFLRPINPLNSGKHSLDIFQEKINACKKAVPVESMA